MPATRLTALLLGVCLLAAAPAAVPAAVSSTPGARAATTNSGTPGGAPAVLSLTHGYVGRMALDGMLAYIKVIVAMSQASKARPGQLPEITAVLAKACGTPVVSTNFNAIKHAGTLPATPTTRPK